MKQPKPEVVQFTGPIRLVPLRIAATYLGVTLGAMRQLVRDRRIPHVMLANRYLLDKLDLDKFIDDQKIGIAA